LKTYSILPSSSLHVERLPWDSSFFGFEVGCGTWAATTHIDRITAACQGLDLVYLNQEPSTAADSAKSHPETFDARIKSTIVGAFSEQARKRRTQ
jgi:hypothetical protein